jgi:hypothetical protein
MITFGEIERTGLEAVVTYSKAVSRNSPVGTEENNGN